MNKRALLLRVGLVSFAVLAACNSNTSTTKGPGGSAGGSGGSTVNGSGGSGGASTRGFGGSPGASSVTPGDSGVVDSGSSTTPANPAVGSKLFLGTNFWNEGWEPPSDYFASNVNWAATINPWNPSLLTDVSAYAHVIRFMDWNRTNDLPDGAWSARAQPTVAPGDRGVAYEWQIDLCNRLKADYWINVPTQADDDHVTRLARLIQSKLDPSLHIYIEYSNEVWNGGFKQADYVDNKGVAMNIMGMNQWYKGWAWYVYRSVQIFELFEAVLGKDSPRLVKVISGQAGYTGDATNPAPICAWHLEALADSTVNPHNAKIDAYAIAPYFNGTSISELSSSIPTNLQYVSNHVACLKGKGIPLIAYEGGSDSYSAGPGCKTLQQDPGMSDLYKTYLTGLASAGMTGPFIQYTHCGECWGLKSATGDTSGSAPKYQGVLAWLAAHP